jgi:hypothetical protein
MLKGREHSSSLYGGFNKPSKMADLAVHLPHHAVVGIKAQHQNRAALL